MSSTSIDPFFKRQKTASYNCLDFVREVWMHLYGEDAKLRLDKLAASVTSGAVSFEAVKAFERLKLPVSPCFVMMYRPRSSPHVGIYLDGRVLHLGCRGVEYQPIRIATQGFVATRYYR